MDSRSREALGRVGKAVGFEPEFPGTKEGDTIHVSLPSGGVTIRPTHPTAPKLNEAARRASLGSAPPVSLPKVQKSVTAPQPVAAKAPQQDDDAIRAQLLLVVTKALKSIGITHVTTALQQHCPAGGEARMAKVPSDKLKSLIDTLNRAIEAKEAT